MRNHAAGSPHKAVTIYDISRLAGVSPATVSRVLSGSARVSEAKRKAVLQAVQDSGFLPNALAQSLASSRTHTIGFLVPDIKNPYFSSIYYHVEILASQNGYAVLLANSRGAFENESRILQALTGRRVDAIVFMGGRIDAFPCSAAGIAELEKFNRMVPLLLTSRVEGTSIPQLCSREDGAVLALMRHLSEQGCRTFAILGGAEDVSVLHRRRALMLACGCRFGMVTQPKWALTDTGFSIESGRQAAAQLLQCGELPDAVCCINDMVAAGALQQLRSDGLQIPQDLLLTGFDGEVFSEVVDPGITTAAFDYPDFAQRIFDLLMRGIHQEPCAPVTELYPHLTIRGSTRREAP
ncbi:MULTISPECIES: LacI family DNA-binding transcriptional regulator [Caproicibacterium]|uniref:LacI family DNA-binding transcriptional regulator n=1 Tax=Caproicibacterium argilliputei TaxID=3030016 RepID=A0AA97H0F0_9FIRM|nr:LacI family DNA-binding transcriptional regulator [Caproicibacterium argilliputei]WOC31378.1 LacI family DNA-binding transcriptional regulator [Caproicibacterium argilliputei]